MHVERVYAALTDDFATALRDERLVYAAAERFPGLTPTRAEVAAELDRKLADKEGVEIAQGTSSGTCSPRRARAHLIDAMLRPTPGARPPRRVPAAGVADLGTVRLTRAGSAGVLELRNPRHLNAEDDTTLPASECAVDLILLDPEIELGVLRSGPVDHPRYSRVFGAGLNLTRLYHGQIPSCSSSRATSATSTRSSAG